MGSSNSRTSIELKGITVTFAENRIVANRDVSVAFERGEAVGVIGENGAGKSTLMHVMSGDVRPTAGQIFVDGIERQFDCPADAISSGIAMVRQHPHIVRSISSWENAILGIEPSWLIGKAASRDLFVKVSERYGLHVAPDRKADTLSAHEAFDLALLSALLRNPKILLLDEPVTTFTESGVQDIASIIDKLTNDGITVGYISHKIEEVLAICSRVLIMRSGEIVGEMKTDGADIDAIASLMLGEHTNGETPLRQAPEATKRHGNVVLELKDVTVGDPAAGPIGPISFKVHSGQCLAITGMRDRGITAIEELLSGHLPAQNGSVHFLGEPFDLDEPRALRNKGIAYIPTDRLIRGSSLQSTLSDNLILLTYRKMQRWGLFKTQEIQEFSSHLKGSFKINGDPSQDLQTLSGGNIQKTILSRELSGEPILVILSEPSWGLDMVGRQTVYERIHDLCNRGSAVIVITTDIEEARTLGHSLAVMYRQEFIPVDDQISKEDLGAVALGVRNVTQ